MQPENAKIATTVEIREMPPSPEAEELKDAATVLACAFHESPLFRRAFPQPDSRRDILRRLFVAVIGDAVRYGSVEVAYGDACERQIVGMVIWYPPGAYPMTTTRLLRFLPRYAGIAAANPSSVAMLWRAERALDRLRPGRPHCHGYFLGARQGERVGATLIRRALRKIDEHNWPTYLETQEPRVTKLYARFGFEMLREEVETLPGGPATWTMWREPRRIGAPESL